MYFSIANSCLTDESCLLIDFVACHIYNCGMLSYPRSTGFEWDQGNTTKNQDKHQVAPQEAEEVFFDSRRREYPDPTHSKQEVRKILVGKTKKGRLLLVVYTTRRDKIRIISARDLNKRKERSLYEKAT